MVAQIPRVTLWGGNILLPPPNMCAPIPPGGGYLVGPLWCTYTSSIIAAASKNGTSLKIEINYHFKDRPNK